MQKSKSSHPRLYFSIFFGTGLVAMYVGRFKAAGWNRLASNPAAPSRCSLSRPTRVCRTPPLTWGRSTPQTGTASIEILAIDPFSRLPGKVPEARKGETHSIVMQSIRSSPLPHPLVGGEGRVRGRRFVFLNVTEIPVARRTPPLPHTRKKGLFCTHIVYTARPAPRRRPRRDVITSCRCGGIGRRDGLKIRLWRHSVGSSPSTGTIPSFS